jgi:hypothetical protein
LTREKRENVFFFLISSPLLSFRRVKKREEKEIPSGREERGMNEEEEKREG